MLSTARIPLPTGGSVASPKLEDRKASSLAYIEHEGPYDKVPWQEYMERLYGWAKEQKVMPGFHPMAIYQNSPNDTPPEKLRSDIAITFKGKAKASSGVKTRDLPAMKVAAVSHKGPGTEFKNTYAKLMSWVEQKGYKLSGPPIEVYGKKPEVIGGVTIIYAKVMFPISKK
jgi:AraC family transcriptional regulator